MKHHSLRLCCTLLLATIGGVPLRPSAPSCAIHFEAGSVYHYSYITDVSLNEANEQNVKGAHTAVGFRLTNDLKLSVIWKKSYDYLIKLEVVKSSLHSVSKESTTAFKELQRFPVFFHWHGDGTVGRVYIALNEKTISSNLKKGIISMLQLQTVEGERTEVDASGECHVSYTVKGNKVTKTKDACRPLEKTGEYKQTRLMLDSLHLGISTTTYEFSEDVVTYAESFDNQILALSCDKSIDLDAHSQQVLKLIGKTAGGPVVKGDTVDQAVEAVDSDKLDLIGMLLGTDVDSPTCLIDCQSLTDAVEKHKSDLVADKMAHIQSAKAFLELLPLFRQASKEQIKAVLKKYIDIRPQLLDLVAAAQTEPSLEAVLEQIDFFSETNYEQPERFILGVGFSTHPHERLLRSLLDLFKRNVPSSQLRESIALALGSVTHTFCRLESQCQSPVVKDISATLVNSLSDCKDTTCTLRVVRAMRNAKLLTTRDVLLRLAESEKDTAVLNAILQALTSINKDYSSIELLSSLNRIYHESQRPYDSGIRTAALDALLSTRPSIQEIRNVLVSSVNQTDVHFATYVLSTIKNLAANRQVFKQKLAQALDDTRINNYNTWSPGGKANALTSRLGKSHNMDVTYDLFMQNAKTGIMKKSGLKVSLRDTEEEQPALMFSLYAQGLESVIDSNAVPQGQEPEEPTAGLSMEMFDVLLRPVEFFRGSSALMSAVWNAPSEPVTALAINVLTQDKRQRVHLQNGFVLEHHLSGVASIELSGFISISLWNQDAHSVIKNRGATVIIGDLGVAANGFLSANVNFNLEASGFIDFITDVNFYASPPQVCLRMANNPFTVRQTWNKTEKASGISKSSKHAIQRTKFVPGASYLLSEDNSRQCTKLLN